MSQHDLRPQHSGNHGYLWRPTASKALPSHLFDWHILFGFSLYLTLVGSPGCSCTWHLPFEGDGWLKRSKCFKHQQRAQPITPPKRLLQPSLGNKDRLCPINTCIHSSVINSRFSVAAQVVSNAQKYLPSTSPTTSDLSVQKTSGRTMTNYHLNLNLNIKFSPCKGTVVPAYDPWIWIEFENGLCSWHFYFLQINLDSCPCFTRRHCMRPNFKAIYSFFNAIMHYLIAKICGPLHANGLRVSPSIKTPP